MARIQEEAHTGTTAAYAQNMLYRCNRQKRTEHTRFDVGQGIREGGEPTCSRMSTVARTIAVWERHGALKDASGLAETTKVITTVLGND
jgi:hypothetical protein